MSAAKSSTAATRAERTRAGSQQRREQAKHDLRAAIIEAAAELFVAHGYAGFSLRQVAEQVGYSATTIYLYFENKDDLLFTVVDQGFARFGEQLAVAAASTADPFERLVVMGRAYVAFGLAQPAHYQLMFMQRADFLLSCRTGETAPRIDAFAVLQEAVAAALAAEVIGPGTVQSLSDMLWAVMHGIVALAISMPFMDAARVAATQAQLEAVLRAGLRTG